MKINPRALRTRLFLLYSLLSIMTVACLGCFSYWSLSRALASSRAQTMDAREKRFVRYINSWPASDQSSTLEQKFRHLSLAIADTDIIQLYSLDGRLLYSTSGHDEVKVPWPDKPCLSPCIGLVRKNGHTIRTLNHVITLDGRPYRLSLSGMIDEHYKILETVRNGYLVFCPLLLIASLYGSYLLSNRALAPVSRMALEVHSIGIKNLQRRLPVPDTDDELQLFAETWNGLLGRLETAVARLTQFTSDVSHDLSTTFAIMLATTSLALNRQRTIDEYQHALLTVSAECEASSRLLQDLIVIACADFAPKEIEDGPVNLSSLVGEVCQNFDAKARLKHQSLRWTTENDLWTRGDQSLLRRMTTILLDNAIKYTPEGGFIAVSLNCGENLIHLAVHDSGIGIAADDLPRIFDRFYRADASRSQEDGSSGLGLAIAKWVAETHDAKINVTSTPGEGSTFDVFIPKVGLSQYDSRLA